VSRPRLSFLKLVTSTTVCTRHLNPLLASSYTYGDKIVVHYRLYSEEGALVSKRSFKEGDPSLGRLNILSIRPPHTVWTLRKRIAKVEDLDPSGLQILADIFSETAVIDNAGLPLVGEAYYVGKTQGQAMACVCGPLDAVTTLERVVTMRQDGTSAVSS
jgi:hypothetical protein